MVQRLRSGQVGSRDGFEARATEKGGIAVGDRNVHVLLPEHVEAVGDQPLPDAFAVMYRCHRYERHHENRARIAP